MDSLETFTHNALQAQAERSLTRTLRATSRQGGARVQRGEKTLISFACNDYFGLTHHPEVLAAAQEALHTYGAGAGASRLITGNFPLYDALESALAAMKGTAAARVFGSGYLANIGVIPALAGRRDLILADKHIHACMLDGARLSGATVRRFTHNDMSACEAQLRAHRHTHRHCLILAETVYSMDGDRAPLTTLLALAHKYDAWLLTDDAHGFGLPDNVGSPTHKHSHPNHIQMGTLSKGLGAYGGYVCAAQPVIDWITSYARSLIFSTALSPATVASALTALNILKKNDTLGKAPLHKARCFTHALGRPDAQSPIVPLILHTPERAMHAAEVLEKNGFLVSAIRPPTVPEGTARLRFAFSAAHNDDDIRRLADVVTSRGWHA